MSTHDTNPSGTGTPPAPRKPRLRWLWWGLPTALLGGAVMFLVLAEGGWEAGLSRLVAPYVELMTQNQGRVGPDGETEYLLLPAGDLTVPDRDAFLQRHPDIVYVREGEIPGTMVIQIPSPAQKRARELRDDPFVSLIMTSRMGVFCH